MCVSTKSNARSPGSGSAASERADAVRASASARYRAERMTIIKTPGVAIARTPTAPDPLVNNTTLSLLLAASLGPRLPPPPGRSGRPVRLGHTGADDRFPPPGDETLRRDDPRHRPEVRTAAHPRRHVPDGQPRDR